MNLNGGKLGGLLLILLLHLNMVLTAQEVPWSYQKTSVKHFISFESVTPLINGDPIEDGDYIGVFYDSGGRLICAGYMEWGQGDSLLIANGRKDGLPGFEPGQSFHYRVWKADENCIAPVAQVGYKPNNYFPDEGKFKANGKSRVAPQNFFGHILTVNFRKSSYCQAEGEATPLVSTFRDSVHFKTEAEGLALDTASGTVNLAESEPGTYEIDLSSHFCLNRDQLSLEILPSAPIGLPDTVVLCPGETKELKPTEAYQQYYWSTGDTSRKLEVSEPGIYRLTAVTQADCLVEDSVVVIRENVPEPDLPDQMRGCDSVSMTINPVEGITYQWSDGTNGARVTFHESGDHWIEAESPNGCKTRDSVKVTISPSMTFDDRHVQVEHAACNARGAIQVNKDAIQGGIEPYQFRVKEIIDGRTLTSSSGTIEDLQPGEYQLTIEDAMGCELELQRSFQVTHQNCENHVIAPNREEANKYYFENQGEIEIYDRTGELVKSLQGPAEWHGRNETGRQVPMGSYQVLINGQQKLQITVIK